MTTALLAPDRKVQAHSEKNRRPYTVTIGARHHRVLAALSRYPNDGLTDAELTFELRLHMAAARRCELRDIGAVRRGGRHKGAWRWKLTQRGRELLAELNTEALQ